jgi:hypothetical protein
LEAVLRAVGDFIGLFTSLSASVTESYRSFMNNPG